MWPTLGAQLQHAPEFSRTRGPSRLFIQSLLSGRTPAVYFVCVMSQCCLIYFFAQTVDILATVRCQEPGTPDTCTHQAMCVPEHVVLSQEGAPSQPCPGEPRALQQGGPQTFSPEEGVGPSSSAPSRREASMGKQSSLYTQGQR